jgi:hypothetical protein
MRKLLLASAALMGAGAAIGGSAYAQVATPPAPSAPVVTTPQMQTLVTGNSGNSANSNNNYQAAMLPGAVANPTPGSMVVRFNGAVWSEFFLGGGDGYVGSGPRLVSTGGLGPFTPGGPAFITSAGTNAGQKLANYSMGTYFRLYPGVDAMATNGLRYGAQVELRENFITAQANTGATGGSGLTSGQTMFVRRAFVYAAGDNWGLIRFGQGDGVTGIFDNGITTGQQPGQGLWNGDAPAMTPANGPTFPWFSQQGAEYGYERIVYLSPQIWGFDFGLQYAPNNGNQEVGGIAATPGAPALSSSITPPQGARFMNQYTVGARYQGTFGPVALYGFGAYIGSGHIHYTGTAASAVATEGGPTFAQGSRYDGTFHGLSAGFVGAAVTWAGFTLAGAWQGGQYNGVMALEPNNGVGANAWVASIYYTSGPFGIGTTYYQFDSQGAIGLSGLSQRHEDAFGIGGTYSVAPGLLAYWEYIYGQRHQAGFDLNNGKYFNQAGYAGGNDNHVQAAVLGVRMRW